MLLDRAVPIASTESIMRDMTVCLVIQEQLDTIAIITIRDAIQHVSLHGALIRQTDS